MRELTLQPNQLFQLISFFFRFYVQSLVPKRIQSTTGHSTEGLTHTITSMKLPGCNLIPRVSKFCLEEWQDIWNCCPCNKLHAIYPTVGSAQHSKIPPHHKEVVINRLRLGHSYRHLTYSYLLSGDEKRTCASCDLPLTIMHILLECHNLEAWRASDVNTLMSIVDVSSLRNLFESVDNQNIIDFIKETHFYNLL